MGLSKNKMIKVLVTFLNRPMKSTEIVRNMSHDIGKKINNLTDHNNERERTFFCVFDNM